MPVNRYSKAQPAQDNYFNTFVPLPLDQLTAMGAARKQDLEKNQALLDKAYDEALDIKYIKESPFEEANFRKISKGVTDLAMEYGSKDLTNPLMMSEMRRKLRSIADPTLIKRMEESYAGSQQYKALQMDMMSKGTWNEKLNKNTASQHNSQMGVFSDLPQAYMGREKLLGPYMDKIHPTFKGIEVRNGMPFMISAVRNEDIKKVANERAGELISTPAGQQEIELFKLDYPDLVKNRNMSDIQIMNQIMEDYGQTYEDAAPLSSEMYKAWAAGQQTPDTGAQPLYGTHGANMEQQFKNENKLNKRISELEATGEPDKLVTAYDLKIGKDKALAEASVKNQQREEHLNNLKSELWATGKFQEPYQVNKFAKLIGDYTRSEYSSTGVLTSMKDRNRMLSAEDFTPDQLQELETLSNKLDANKAGDFVKKIFNPASGLYKQFSKLMNMPAVAAAVIEKTTDKYGKYKDISLSDLIQKNKESLGIDNIPKDYNDLPGAVDRTDIWSISNKYASKIAKADQSDSKNISQSILEETSKTTSPSYSFNLPYYSSGNLDVRVDQSTGEKLGVFNPTTISNDILSDIKNYEIISVNDEESMNQKKKDEAVKSMNTNDIQSIKIDVLPDAKYGYNPVVEYVYNHVKDGTNTRSKLKLVVNNPTQQRAFADILDKNGDKLTATAIRQPQVAQTIANEKFEPGKKVTYYLRDNYGNKATVEAKFVVMRNADDPTQFDIIYPISIDEGGEAQYQTTTAPSRQELTALIYQLTAKNGLIFDKE